MLKTWVGLGCALVVVACGGGGSGGEGPSDESSSTAPASTESSSTAPGTTESSSTAPGTTESSSTEPGDTEPGDTEPGDTDSDPACVPPQDIVGCEGLVPPTEDPGGARGILVEAERAVLTFSDVNDPQVLCADLDLEGCACESWGSTLRLTIDGALAVGTVAPEMVEVQAAGGDCFASASSGGEVLELELTEITDTCVVGRLNVTHDFAETGQAFGFVAPRCD